MSYSSPNLTKSDLFVLKYVCEKFIEDNGGHLITSESVLEAAQQEDLADQDIKDSLVILGERDLLKTHYVMDGKDYPAETHPAFGALDIYYRSIVTNFDDLWMQVASLLTNISYGEGELSKLAQTVNQPTMLVNHILEDIELQGYIQVHRSFGGHAVVGQVSPSLKRVLKI